MLMNKFGVPSQGKKWSNIKENLINSGYAYSAWNLYGTGSTKDVNGIHLVANGSAELASLPTNLLPSTSYTLEYEVTANTATTGSMYMYNSGLIATSILMPKTVGVNKIKFTTVADLTNLNKLNISHNSSTTDGQYTDIKNVRVYLGDTTALTSVTKSSLISQGKLPQLAGKTMQKTLIWYTYILPINGQSTLDGAANVYAQFDQIVFGDHVQEPTHGSHADCVAIIPKIRALKPNVQIFGYIPIGGSAGANRDMTTLKTAVDQWVQTGANGIFLDEYGYGYGVSRDRQNEIVDYVHSYGIPVIANCWDADQCFSTENIYSSTISFYGNPNLLPTRLTTNDYCLIESFAINDGVYTTSSGYETANNLHTRTQKYVDYRKVYGTKLMTLSKHEPTDANLQAKVQWHYNLAMFYSLDTYACEDLHQYATSSDKMLISYTTPTSIISDKYYDASASFNHYLTYKYNQRPTMEKLITIIHDDTAPSRTLSAEDIYVYEI